MPYPLTLAMEYFSVNLINTIVTEAGYDPVKPEKDFGVDITLRCPVVKPSGKVRTDGRAIDIQLKSCLAGSASIKRTSTHIRYRLEAKNYNDMVDRIIDVNPIPLILILVILPDEPTRPVSLKPNLVELHKEAFWYRIPTAPLPTPSTSTSTVTIEIPITQEIDLTSCDYFFANFL